MQPNPNNQQSTINNQQFPPRAFAFRPSAFANQQSTINNQQFLPSFTLVELMIAVVVLAVLLGMVGMIYKSSSDAISQSNATTEIHQNLDVLRRQVQQDLSAIVRDGYLVIYGWDRTNDLAEQALDGRTAYDTADGLTSARTDAILFFTTGNFRSLTTPHAVIPFSVTSNAGWVYLGHAGSITPAEYGTTPFDPSSAGNPLIVNRWVLSRYLLLFTPAVPPGATDDFQQMSLGQWTSVISIAIVGATDQQIRNAFYNTWVQGAAVGTPPAIDFDAATPVTFPYTLPHCGHFEIEFAMPTPGASHQPEMNAGQIHWRSALVPDPGGLGTWATLNVGGITPGGRTNDQMVVFRPTDTWPLLIRFTLRLYDRNLSVTSFDDDLGLEHAGRTFTFVVPMPD